MYFTFISNWFYNIFIIKNLSSFPIPSNISDCLSTVSRLFPVNYLPTIAVDLMPTATVLHPILPTVIRLFLVNCLSTFTVDLMSTAAVLQSITYTFLALYAIILNCYSILVSVNKREYRIFVI